MRLAGCTRPVAARSASLSITRGAKLAKPAPRSGSMTMMRAMRSLASPSSSASPTARPSESSSAGRPRRCPAPAPRRRRRPSRRRVAQRAAAAQRIGVADRLDADQRESRRPSRRAARPMLGKLAVVAVTRPSARARCRNVAGAGWSLETIASPPSSWRASRARPPLMRSAKKPTAVSAATASVTATTSRRSSPARKSRTSWRQPSCQAEGDRGPRRTSASSASGVRQRRASSSARNLPELANAACNRVESAPARAVLQ